MILRWCIRIFIVAAAIASVLFLVRPDKVVVAVPDIGHPKAQAATADRLIAAGIREQRLDVVPNDTRYTEQWWLRAVAAGNTGAAGFTTAWSQSTGAPTAGAAPVIAVLDSGITSHPELNPRLVPGYDFVSDTLYSNDGNGRDNDPADPGDAISDAERSANPAAFGGCPAAPLSSWHGTVIAGQVAAVSNNTEGVAAGTWNGRVLPVRVAGRCGAAVGDIIDGLRWAAGLVVAGVPPNLNPARLIVLSYGGVDPCDAASPTPEIAATARLYLDTIAQVRAAGALVVVAAGNRRSLVGRPASCAGAFGVAALNREGYKATYSNFGPGLALATPGGDAATGGTCDVQLADTGLVSTSNLGDTSPGAAGYAAASGTSFAAPAVTAVGALMLAVNPALTVDQIEDGLKRSSRPHVRVPLLGECAAGTATAGRCECTTALCGAGILDAAEALRYAAAPAGYAAPARTAPTLDDSRIRDCAVLLGRPVPADPVPPVPPAPDPPASGGGGGGGAGAVGWLWTLALATATWAAWAAGAANAAGPTPREETRIRRVLAERMPNLPAIDEIRRAPIAGLYEVRMGLELLYVDGQAKHLIRGPIVDTRTKINLTEARIEELSTIHFSALRLSDAIVFRQGDGSRRLAVFVDPNCGFCKRFERDLAALKDVTVYTFLYPILGADSLTKSRDVWCARDPARIWRDWMISGVLPPTVPAAPAVPDCDTSALERNDRFGRKHRVQSTPETVFENGRRVPGAIRAEELERAVSTPPRRG